MQARRQQDRVRVDLPLVLVADDGTVARGRVTDLSVGGLRVETAATLAFASRVVARLKLPGSTGELNLPAVVRWMRPGVVGLQFASLGARETHLITALTAGSCQTLDSQDVAWIG